MPQNTRSMSVVRKGTMMVAEKRGGLFGGWWISVVVGILAVFIGVMLLFNPTATVIRITYFIGIWWMLNGALNIASLLIDRELWGWKLFSGVLGLFAGALVLSHATNSPLLAALGLATIYVVIIAIEGILIGISELMKAFQGGGLGNAFLGILSLLFGILLLFNPFGAALALPFVFGILAIIFGGSAIGAGLRMRSA